MVTWISSAAIQRNLAKIKPTSKKKPISDDPFADDFFNPHAMEAFEDKPEKVIDIEKELKWLLDKLGIGENEIDIRDT